MDFDFSFGRQGGGERPDEEDPFRLLLLGGFSGHGGSPLAERKPLRVDIDNFDRVLAAIAPRLTLEVGGARLELTFSSLDDFHPDGLFERVDLFAGLRGLRSELRDPALFRRAAAAMGAAPPDRTATAPGGEEASGDIERLLGRKPDAAPAASTSAAPGGVNIDGLLRDIVAPHVVPDTGDQQRELIAAADAAIAEQMRLLLHHPEFQALEALWRSADRLVRELEAVDTLQIDLMDCSRDDLLQDVAAHTADMSQSMIQRLLCGSDGAGAEGRRWSLLVCDQAFGADAAEMALLALLGSMAAKAGAPLLAAARTELVGCTASAQLVSPGSWASADDPALAAWNALRRSSLAPWVGLALPRILQRLPYGKATDPVAAFGFEEFAGERVHEHYLWGSAAFALALLAGRAFQEDGWEMMLDTQSDLDDLPSHVYREDGEPHQQPAAEVLMSEPAAQAALERGVMPFMSYRNRNAARLLRWQSIASPPVALAGAWQD